MSTVLSAVPSVSPNATGVLPGTIAAFTVDTAEVCFGEANGFPSLWMCGCVPVQ